jgi:hypothetical protein
VKLTKPIDECPICNGKGQLKIDGTDSNIPCICTCTVAPIEMLKKLKDEALKLEDGTFKNTLLNNN